MKTQYSGFVLESDELITIKQVLQASFVYLCVFSLVFHEKQNLVAGFGKHEI